MNLSLIAVAIWVVTLAVAAISDLRAFRIPNLLPAIVIMLFVVMHGITGFSSSLWPNLLHFLLALGVGMLLFGRGWIGGGDAKLYAAVALWFNWGGAAALIFLTTLSGLILAIAFVAARMLGLRRQRENPDKKKARMERRIPYGVAIAAGAILTAAWVGWSAVFPTIG
jgi:prepilin peptidase CpaA